MIHRLARRPSSSIAWTQALRQSQGRLLTSLFYLALALVINGPLLSPGYVLAFDMVFGPTDPSPRDLFYGFQAPIQGARLIPQAIISGLGSLIPTWAVQKLVLVAIFLLAGLGAHQLPPTRTQASRYFAGILYVVNPFVYARFLAGQWYILLAYAIAPFAIKGFISLLERPGRKTFAATLALTSLVAISSHILALTLLAYAFIYAFWSGYRVRGTGYGVRGDIPPHPVPRTLYPWHMAGLAIAFLAINAYWLVPAITAKGTLLEAITERDLEVFAPDATIASPWMSIATMHGFWRGGYEYAATLFPPVILVFGVFLWLALYGLFATIPGRVQGTGYRAQGDITPDAGPRTLYPVPPYVPLALAILAFVGFALATGVTGPFEPVTRFLADKVPTFDGFRDSQKFVFLLVLAYVYLGALGIEALAAQLEGRHSALRLASRGVIGLALLAPAAYSFTMFWGFHGYVRAVSYPPEWRAVRNILDADGRDAGVLTLPWDSYIEYGWVPNRDNAVRTLARAFFSQPLVYPERVIRQPGIYSQSFGPEQAYVQNLINQANTEESLGAKLVPLGVRYVILAKDIRGATFYRFLYRQNDLELVLDAPTIALFRNRHEVSRAYLADAPEIPEDIGQLRPAEAVRLSPFRYQVRDAISPYVVFIPSNADSSGWRLGGQAAVSGPGYYGVFRVRGDGVLTYQPFYFNLIWYSVSGVALAGVTAILLAWGRPHPPFPPPSTWGEGG